MATIGSQSKLLNDALKTVLDFIAKIPGLMVFEIDGRKSWKLANGKSKRGNWAVLKVYIKSKRGTKTLVEELLIGAVKDAITAPRQLSAPEVAGQLSVLLAQGISAYLPLAPEPVAQTKVQELPDERIIESARYKVGDKYFDSNLKYVGNEASIKKGIFHVGSVTAVPLQKYTPQGSLEPATIKYAIGATGLPENIVRGLLQAANETLAEG